MKIGIVGYGSKIRNDDAVGLDAIDILKEKFKSNSNIEYFYGSNAVDLLGEFDNFDKMILIDCAMINREPGEFIRAKVEDINFSDDTSITHSANFKTILENAKLLGIKAPELVFYMIRPKNVDMGETISPELKSGLNAMIIEISKEIGQ